MGEGYAADLLVLAGNPLEDPLLLADPGDRLLMVIKDGARVHGALPELQRAQGDGARAGVDAAGPAGQQGD